MTPEQINLVQDSFDKIKPHPIETADLFYERLFAIAPEVRPLFPDDMSEQKRMLMTVLAMAVAGLGRLDKLRPALEELGLRHVDYGVKPDQYRILGDALLWAIEQRLGEDFTPETRCAWTKAYADLAAAMIDASDYRRRGDRRSR